MTIAYYYKREYDKAWEDVYKAQSLRLLVRAGFLKALREASGRERRLLPLENKTKEKKTKTTYIDNLIEDSLFTRMASGVIKVGLVALVRTIIGVGVYGCKKSEDYYNRGIAHFKKDENDRAISDFTKAIKMNPRFAMAYYYRGMVYHRKKEYDQVISDYTRAIEIDPQRFAVAYAERTFIYYIKKEYDKA